MTFEAAAPRYSPRRTAGRTGSLLPVKARKFLPVKWQPIRRMRQHFGPRFYLAMAVSIISSISFLWVLFLAIMAG